MAEVIVNIKANTGQATDSVDDLNNSLNQTTESADELSASLSKQEARIKTLDGAINLIGGSVEILAGGLALSGALTEEQAEKFQTAAIGAIAFADGTKRVLDGYKSLNEGLAAYGGVSKIATKATTLLNNAIKANPAVAIAVAVAALTAAIYAYVTSTSAAEKAEMRYYDSQKKLIENQGVQLNREYDLAKARGASIDELHRLELQTYANAKAEQQLERQRLQAIQRREGWSSELAAEINATGDAIEEINHLEAVAVENYNKLKREEVEANKEAEEAKTAKEKEEAAKRAQDRKDAREKEMQDAFDFYLRMIKLARDKRKEFEKEFNDQLTKENQATFDATTKAMEARMKQSTTMIQSTGQQAQKSTVEVASANLFAYNELAENAVGSSVEAFGQLFTALADVTGEGNEEAFEKGKKFKIAEVVTSAIQASFQAFGAAQQFGPILGPILGAAQVAAIAVASNKAIGDIKSSTFQSSTAPSTSTPSVSVPTNFNTGPQGMGQFLPFTAPQQTPPVRAYVVTGDVTDGQVAEAQLQTRRRFG